MHTNHRPAVRQPPTLAPSRGGRACGHGASAAPSGERLNRAAFVSPILPRQRFARRLTLTRDAVADYAAAAGDHNPLHYDEASARASRFGDIIASGPHTSGLLMGLAATYFGRFGPMVGLEFRFAFRAPVFAGDEVVVEWLVVQVVETSSGRGQVVDLRGRIRVGASTAVGAAGRVLVAPSL